MTIELIKADELRLVANGPGKQGRVGVLYQVQPTGECYRWDGAKHVGVAGPGGGTVDAASVQAALSSDQAGARSAMGLGTAATQATTAFASAAQGADAREWAAATVDQAEAEAGADTTRRAWTSQRVRQASAAAIAALRPEVATFADLPAANTVVPGRAYTLTTVGQRWYSDGSNWRPVNGRVIVAQRCGSLASPLATLTGVTAGQFSLPVVPTIPAGMLFAGARIVVEAAGRRTTGTATALIVVRIGTSGTSSDSALYSTTWAATANSDWRVSAQGVFGSTSSVTTTGATTFNSFATSSSADRTSNINTNAQMVVSFDIASANSADSFGLWHYSVAVES